MKKMNNKGFSLVELIVVIAIMAVLMGVLAPTLIGNIEKSRESKDLQNLDSIYNAINTVLATETGAKEGKSAYASQSTKVNCVLAKSAAAQNSFDKKLIEALGTNVDTGSAACVGEDPEIYFYVTSDLRVCVYLKGATTGAPTGAVEASKGIAFAPKNEKFMVSGNSTAVAALAAASTT